MWSSTSMARSQSPILPYTSTSVLYVTTFGVQLSCAQPYDIVNQAVYGYTRMLYKQRIMQAVTFGRSSSTYRLLDAASIKENSVLY